MKVEQPMRWKEKSEDHEIFLSFPIRKKKTEKGPLALVMWKSLVTLTIVLSLVGLKASLEQVQVKREKEQSERVNLTILMRCFTVKRG